jgi:hypothetical protein
MKFPRCNTGRIKIEYWRDTIYVGGKCGNNLAVLDVRRPFEGNPCREMLVGVLQLLIERRDQRLGMVLFRIGADHELHSAEYRKRVEQFAPHWLRFRPLMPRNIGAKRLHDVAEHKLVKIDDLLLKRGKLEREHVPTRPAAPGVFIAANAEYTEFVLAALRAVLKRASDENAWINLDCLPVAHEQSISPFLRYPWCGYRGKNVQERGDAGQENTIWEESLGCSFPR